MDWEQIDNYTSRCRVPRGWLVRIMEPVTHNLIDEGRGMTDGWDFRPALCFYPDPYQEWIIEKKEK
jgi:hypothetical protein